MPQTLSPAQKDWVIRKSGYDPAEYELTDDGYIQTKVSVQPAVSSVHMGNSDITNKPSPAPVSTTPFQAGAMSFGEAAPAAIGTGIGTAGGAALASWLLGPEVGLPATLLFALGGGIGGGIATRKLQNVVEPEQWQQSVAQAQQEHPVAGTVGSLATIPLSGFNPSPTTAIRAAGAIPKVLTGLERTPQEIAALRNVGMGATIGAAGSVAQNLVENQSLPSIPQVGESALIGALFNKPNVIGRGLGFHPAPEVDPLQAMLKEAINTPTDLPVAEQSPVNLMPGMTPEQIVSAGGTPTLRGLRETKGGVIKSAGQAMAKFKGDLFPTPEELARLQGEGGIEPRIAQKDIPVTSAGETEADLQAQLAEFKKGVKMEQQEPAIPRPEKKTEPTDKGIAVLLESALKGTDEATLKPEDADEIHTILKNQIDWTKAPNVKQALDRPGFDTLDPDHWIAVNDEYNKFLNRPKEPIDLGMRKGTPLPSTAPVEPIKETGKPLPIEKPATPKVKKQPFVKPPTKAYDYLSNIYRQFAKEVVGSKGDPKEFYLRQLRALDATRNAAAKAGDLDTVRAVTDTMSTLLKDAGIHMQEQSALKQEVNKDIQEQLPEGGNIKEWNRVLSEWGQKMRGATVKEDNTITNSKGEPISGEAWLRNSLRQAFVNINPDKAGIDTLPHELFHVFFNDLRNSTKPADRALVKKFEDKVINTPEYKESGASSVEEFITQGQGLEFVKRQLELGGKESGIKQWYRDMVAHLKTKYTKTATIPEYRRLLNYKFTYGKPFEQSPHLSSFSSLTPPVKQNQEEPKISGLETDIQSYRDLDAIRNRMIADGSAFNEDKSAFTPEFKQLWQSIEDIKNRHQGMPPESKRMQEEPAIPPEDSYYRKLANMYHDNLNDLGYDVDAEIHNNKIWDVNAKGYVHFSDLDAEAKHLAIQYKNAWNNAGGDTGALNEIEQAVKKHNKNINESAIKRQPGEERDKYPFTLKELEKTHKFLSELAGSDEYRDQRAYDMFPIDTPNAEKELKRNQESPQIARFVDSPERKQSFAPIATARVDKVAEKLKSPTADYATQQFHKFFGETDYLSGQIGNRLIAATKPYDKASISKVYQYLHEVDDVGKSNIRLSAPEKQLSDNIVKILRNVREYQNTLGLKVKAGSAYRAGGMKPEGYMFNMLSPEVAYTWAEKPNSPEAAAYDKAYIAHQMKHGVTEAEAKEILSEYKNALGNYRTPDPEFQALRRAEGNGLPWKLVDQNFATASTRYGNRAAKDLAFFKHIQSDPKMLQALQLKDQFGDRPKPADYGDTQAIAASHEVQEVMRSVFGIDQPRNITAMAAARSVSNMVMGIGTGLRNVANMPSFIAGYVQLKQLPLVAKAITNLNESRIRAFQNNSVRASFQDFDAAGIYQGSPNPLIRLLNTFSEYARKYQGRDLSNRFEGEFYNSLGELLATDNIARAKTGDKEAAMWVKRFGDIVEGGSGRLLKPGEKITQDDISRMAKRFVDAARGTYGPEGLPSWAIEGEFAPFAALSRFSIEKSNTIWKDVILPAKKGIYGPLIRYTLGSLGTGLLIEKLNELLTNKRGQEPTVNEILASGNESQLIPKAISLLQLSSFAGILGDSAQLLSHAAQGKSTTTVQPLSFPLWTFATDTMAGNISQAAQAISDGEDPFQILAQLATSIGTQGVQSYRYLDSNVIHPEDAKRKEKFRDYNIYQELTGTKEPDASMDKPNPFQNYKIKQFKKTEDIQEAAGMLPDLLKDAIDNAKGNPERLKAELQKIKQNNYQTMPSPASMPLSFRSYLMYLQQTQGTEAAAKRLEDYLKQNAVNQFKSQMVPSI